MSTYVSSIPKFTQLKQKGTSVLRLEDGYPSIIHSIIISPSTRRRIADFFINSLEVTISDRGPLYPYSTCGRTDRISFSITPIRLSILINISNLSESTEKSPQVKPKIDLNHQLLDCLVFAIMFHRNNGSTE